MSKRHVQAISRFSLANLVLEDIVVERIRLQLVDAALDHSERVLVAREDPCIALFHADTAVAVTIRLDFG